MDGFLTLIDEDTFQTMTTFVAIETLKKEVVRRKDTFLTKLDVHCIDLIENPDFILPKRMEKMVDKENSKSSIFHSRLFSVSSVFRRIGLTKVAEQGQLGGRATVCSSYKGAVVGKGGMAWQSWELGGLQMI